MAKGKTAKTGRDAKSGKSAPAKAAKARPKTTAGETIKKAKKAGK